MAAMLGETRNMLQTMLANWQVRIPTGILALLTYLLLVRLVLEVLLGAGSRAKVVRALLAVTNPLVRAVGTITPRVVSGVLLTACAIFWLLTARIALVQLAALMAMLHRGPR
jgi:hypothetical protein